MGEFDWLFSVRFDDNFVFKNFGLGYCIEWVIDGYGKIVVVEKWNVFWCDVLEVMIELWWIDDDDDDNVDEVDELLLC